MKIWKLYVENYSCYHVRTKVLTKFRFDLDLFTQKCIGTFLLPSCIYVWKYKSCTLKTTQIIFSEPKFWQSSVVTLTFDLLTPKCKGIFLSPSCIYVWNMKAVRWKLLKLLCQNQSVDKVPLWPWLQPFDPKMYRYLPLTILHLCMKYESCHWNLLK